MATWSKNGKPDWLKEDQAESGASTSWETVPQNDSITGASTVRSAGSDDGLDKDRSPKKAAGICSKIATFISFIFFGLFVTGAYFFENDRSLYDSQWMGFYCFQAAMAGLSILCRWCCPETLGYLMTSLSFGALIWSITLCVFTGLRYNKENSDDTSGTTPTLDGLYDDIRGSDQSALELTSALLGMVSAFFHITLWLCKCC
jgi:hypothetical protein